MSALQKGPRGPHASCPTSPAELGLLPPCLLLCPQLCHNHTPMLEVRCPHCGLVILVPDNVQGRTGLCFGCGLQLQVPLAPEDAAPQEITYRRGEQISGRYVIKELIGRGGMGIVYRALDTLLDENVALKFMRPQRFTEKGRRVFMREAQIARRLRHENIVAVHDVSTTASGILYISMELLKGRSLRDFLKNHRQTRKLIDVRLAVTIISQVLAALEYAHRMVIHRDVKPENIMLLSGEWVKVLDFGLAKAIAPDQAAQPSASGKTKHVIGTLAYAAPEQVKRREIDSRADLYAVGLVLQELLTLRTPIDEPVEIPEVRNDVSPSILSTLYRALKDDVADRWQHAGDFRHALLDAFE
ncbi:MAG TPA: serine/threonine protein kinase, partial [Candidatus Hydrogenedentes bacterium]|nr:serine/threonine protein kinase [Candidatus Hydrogenedentota bacterium]